MSTLRLVPNELCYMLLLLLFYFVLIRRSKLVLKKMYVCTARIKLIFRSFSCVTVTSDRATIPELLPDVRGNIPYCPDTGNCVYTIVTLSDSFSVTTEIPRVTDPWYFDKIDNNVVSSLETIHLKKLWVRLRSVEEMWTNLSNQQSQFKFLIAAWQMDWWKWS